MYSKIKKYLNDIDVERDFFVMNVAFDDDMTIKLNY